MNTRNNRVANELKLGLCLALDLDLDNTRRRLCRLFAEVQAASSAAYRTLWDLEWEVESTTVTHSSADWWDILLPLACMYVYIYSPDMDIQKYTVTMNIIVNSVKISSPIGTISNSEVVDLQ